MSLLDIVIHYFLHSQEKNLFDLIKSPYIFFLI